MKNEPMNLSWIMMLSLALGLGATLRAEEGAEKLSKPSPVSESKTPEDLNFDALQREHHEATEAYHAKLAQLSPAFAAVKAEWENANRALGRDKDNPELKKAGQEAMQKFFKVRGEETRKLGRADEEMVAIMERFKAAQSAYMRARPSEFKNKKAEEAN